MIHALLLGMTVGTAEICIDTYRCKYKPLKAYLWDMALVTTSYTLLNLLGVV